MFFQVVHNILHVLPLFGKKVSASIENEYLQGWPWMMYLIDTAFVTVAMGGTAFGASPFPEIARGKFTLFFLWITALKEVNTLVGLLLSTYYKKAYKQVGDRGVRYPWLHLIFCCEGCKCLKNDMPWCIKQKHRPIDTRKRSMHPNSKKL